VLDALAVKGLIVIGEVRSDITDPLVEFALSE